ncbi:hypothetical protein HOP38_02620 [Vibrio mediterranei]|uniref:hypothetical protein n=1 Tax=Vibrio mediterranei TaxID=689 RepID=UPI0018360001|nr:hypothetical protein [Vibrio mediterranei]NUW71404.1 hypothetical protein [Vibrio mediterranei]
MKTLREKFDIWANKKGRKATDLYAVAKLYLDNCDDYHSIKFMERLVDADVTGNKHKLYRYGFKFERNPKHRYEFRLIDIDLNHKQKQYDSKAKEKRGEIVKPCKAPSELAIDWRIALGMTFGVGQKERCAKFWTNQYTLPLSAAPHNSDFK